jgi:hypothetical protein
MITKPNKAPVCPESCRLLAGGSPVAVMVRQPRSRQPVFLPQEPPQPQGGLRQPAAPFADTSVYSLFAPYQKARRIDHAERQ